MTKKKNGLQNLAFNYPSTSRMRFLISNCYECPEYPHIYGIVTEKLTFTIAKALVIKADKYVYIPKANYMEILNKYFHKLSLA